MLQNEDIDNGYHELYIPTEQLNTFYKQSQLPIKEVTSAPLNPHQFVIMKGMKAVLFLGMLDQKAEHVKRLIYDQEHVWGIRPKNVQQTMALELLLRRDIPLVTLIGKAGTGKTLLALAAGLMQTEDLGMFKN